jgi:hypothetical protein
LIEESELGAKAVAFRRRFQFWCAQLLANALIKSEKNVAQARGNEVPWRECVERVKGIEPSS